ncbi:hypothetical protein TNCV_2376821 [Trichonephila clavipes]|nr:hypothetical protein TNCV_2376821 [Trichonephila clavipes]
MALKATANDRRHLALCHEEFRGPRSGLCRSVIVSQREKTVSLTSELCEEIIQRLSVEERSVSSTSELCVKAFVSAGGRCVECHPGQ